MYKRTKIELYLTKEEMQMAFDYFRYIKTFKGTAYFINFLLWRKGVDKKVNYRIVSRWLRRKYPVMTEALLRQREEQRKRWREEKKQKENYDLKGLIIIGRRSK